MRNSLLKNILGLAGWLAVTFIAGGVGAIASISAASFYASLSQPTWAPPPWLFGPVWSTLYLLMGIAAWLVWRRHGVANAATALRLFVVQLAANALWTWLFFRWHLGTASLIEIAILWLLIVASVVAFWRLHRLAAVMLVPYLAWVSFASALTLAMVRLNPAVFG